LVYNCETFNTHIIHCFINESDICCLINPGSLFGHPPPNTLHIWGKGGKMPHETEEKSSEIWFSEGSSCQSTTCAPQTNGTVLRALKEKLSQPSQRHRSEPFCVMDLGYVYNEYQRWTSLLPDVKPFYGLSPHEVSVLFPLWLSGLTMVP
jgi:hypothetical protein